MNSENNSIPFENMESDKIKELYKKTPLKKRPIQPSSLSPDEKKIAVKPKSCAVPEGRLSKRKMLKPTKKLIDTYVESTAALEPVPKAIFVPVIKTPTETKASLPVEGNHKAVGMAMAMAIPELKKACVGTEVPPKTSKSSKALYYKNLTDQEWEDFNLAIELQKEEFNLRERLPRRSAANFRNKLKHGKSSIKTENTSADNMKFNYISSPKMRPNKVGGKQVKQEIKRTSKRNSVTIKKGRKNALGRKHSQVMYILSPELADIVGHQKMSSGAIVDAMLYVFLERNLFESDKNYVKCDTELSEKIFSGKRRLRIVDVKNYLRRHLTPSD